MSDENEINWQALSAPFNPADVDFRPQMGKSDGAGARVQAVCYIDARVVADRLDEVVGPGEWSFHYEPLVIERGEIQLAKGALTIHGVTKEDVGDGSTFATSKGCVSDALKRAAVLWGIGRYLYSQPTEWVTLDQHKRIPEPVIAQLRARLPRPAGAQPVIAQQPFVAHPHVIHSPADEPAPTSSAATAQQQELMRQKRNQLRILDKSIEKADNLLNYQMAEDRIKAYDAHIANRQQKASAR